MTVVHEDYNCNPTHTLRKHLNKLKIAVCQTYTYVFNPLELELRSNIIMIHQKYELWHQNYNCCLPEWHKSTTISAAVRLNYIFLILLNSVKLWPWSTYSVTIVYKSHTTDAWMLYKFPLKMWLPEFIIRPTILGSYCYIYDYSSTILRRQLNGYSINSTLRLFRIPVVVHQILMSILRSLSPMSLVLCPYRLVWIQYEDELGRLL